MMSTPYHQDLHEAADVELADLLDDDDEPDDLDGYPWAPG